MSLLRDHGPRLGAISSGGDHMVLTSAQERGNTGARKTLWLHTQTTRFQNARGELQRTPLCLSSRASK